MQPLQYYSLNLKFKTLKKKTTTIMYLMYRKLLSTCSVRTNCKLTKIVQNTLNKIYSISYKV